MLLVSGAAQSIEADEFWLSVELAMSTELLGGKNWWKILERLSPIDFSFGM
jgi:hypothetical protein